MAQQQKLATPPRTDLELIRKCAELVKDLGVTEHSELNVTFAFGQPQNGWKPWLLDEEQWPDLIEQGGTAISSAHLVLRTAAKNQPGFRVNWSRRPFPDPPSLDLTLSTPNDFPDPIKAARVTREKFEAYDGNYLLSHLDDESKAFIAEVKRHQAALREMSIKLGQDLVARRAELEEEFDLNRTKLEEAHSKRIEKLESEWAKKSEQHQQRVDEIEGLKARHSRRQLRDDLKTDLKSKQERFTLTNETNAKAQFVWIWLAILGVLAVCLIAVPMPWLADGLGTEVAPWYELGRRLLGGVGLALVGGYALQWQS